jgi:hypothetical protein
VAAGNCRRPVLAGPSRCDSGEPGGRGRPAYSTMANYRGHNLWHIAADVICGKQNDSRYKQADAAGQAVGGGQGVGRVGGARALLP